MRIIFYLSSERLRICMDFIEILDTLKYIEKQYPVELWEVHKVKVWPLIREKLIYALYGNNAYNDVSRKTKLKKFHQICKYVKNCKSNILDTYKADVLILHDNINRNILLSNGEWYDHNLDPIVDVLEKNKIRYISLENFIFENNIKIPCYCNSSVVNYKLLFHRLKYVIKKPSIVDVYLPEYDVFLNKVNAFDKDLKEKLKIKNLVHEVTLLEIYSEFFEKLLNLHGIKMVLFSCWYAAFKYALSMACNRIGIPVVDVQHGSAGSGNHPFYKNWTKFPINGRYEVLPSAFLCWTKEDEEAISSWNSKYIKAFCVGKPISYVLNDMKNKIHKTNILDGNDTGNLILLSLTWGKEIPSWLSQFILSNHEYIWVIRYHPKIDEHQVRFIETIKNSRNVIIDGVASYPLEWLLERCFCHITTLSSTVRDALFMGKPSIVVDREGLVYFADLLQNDNVFLAFSTNELQKAIKKIKEVTPCSKKNDFYDLELIVKQLLYDV